MQAVLITELLNAAACIYGAALADQNAELQVRMRFTTTDLLKMPGAELLAFSKSIQRLTEESDFSAFGFEDADLSSLENAVTAFEAWVNRPRFAITNRIKATQRLKTLLSTMSELLKYRLDRAMVKMATLSPDLYLRYHSARVIVDLSNAKGREAAAAS